VDEDAFITFRVVDNFVHGFGLRWNINERVQSYTNPLWMLLHIPIYAITNNIIVTTCILGWGCLLATLLLVRDTFLVAPMRYTALFLIPLLILPTNAAYFTSGLENPLLNLLFACFGFVIVRRPKHFWFWCSFVTTLSAFTRLDTVIFYAPVWIYLFYSQRKTIHWKDITLGYLPLAGWLCFSFFYYGFLLPNTALAKLGGHLPLTDYLRSGIAYAYDSMLADPWSAAAIFAALVYFPYQAWKNRVQPSYEIMLAVMIACGTGVYCLYVIYIGGAQLSLRMLSLPAFAICWLWAWRFPLNTHIGYVGFILMVMCVQAFVAVSPQERSKIPMIANAKISGTPWAHYLFIKNGPSLFDYVLDIADIKAKPDHAPHAPKTQISNLIGNFGYYSGPSLIIIDPAGLSDPLLARLPAIDNDLVKVGDVFRYIPPGYKETILTGSTANLPPPLAHYYEKLQLITRGDLWSLERLKTILLFNIGAYDGLKDQYIHEFYPRKID